MPAASSVYAPIHRGPAQTPRVQAEVGGGEAGPAAGTSSALMWPRGTKPRVAQASPFSREETNHIFDGLCILKEAGAPLLVREPVSHWLLRESKRTWVPRVS